MDRGRGRSDELKLGTEAEELRGLDLREIQVRKGVENENPPKAFSLRIIRGRRRGGGQVGGL